MASGLDKLKGITAKQEKSLKDAGVRGLGTLLKWGSTPDGRQEIAKATRISQRKIANWVHRADLMRVRGIDDDYARLIARAGVESIVDLSTRNPEELEVEVKIAAKMERLVKRVPSHKVLAKWIEEARLLIRHVWYHDTWGDPDVTGREPPRYQGPRYDI